MVQEQSKQQLAMQSMQIEQVMRRHNVAGRIVGGRQEGRWARFDLQGLPGSGLDGLRVLKLDLMATLRVPTVKLYQRGGRWRIEFRQAREPAVPLLTLLAQVPELPPATAVLGWTDSQQPLLLNLRQETVAHLLLTGSEAAGKTVLMQTVALSLALLNRQAQVQLAVIDPDLRHRGANGGGLSQLNYLPHLLTPVVDQVEEAAELLAFLVDEMTYRRSSRSLTPTIVLLVDNLRPLLEAGGPTILGLLTKLAQHGSSTGIHLVLGAGATVASLDRFLRAAIPVHITGRVATQRLGRGKAGPRHRLASDLLGQGDFYANIQGQEVRFQAACATGYDLQFCLDRLHRRSGPVLVARPVDRRNRLETVTPFQSFVRTGQGAVQFSEWVGG